VTGAAQLRRLCSHHAQLQERMGRVERSHLVVQGSTLPYNADHTSIVAVDVDRARWPCVNQFGVYDWRDRMANGRNQHSIAQIQVPSAQAWRLRLGCTHFAPFNPEPPFSWASGRARVSLRLRWEPEARAHRGSLFAVMAPHWDGTKRAMDEEKCRKHIPTANPRSHGKPGELSAADRVRAVFQAHIGQPVIVKSWFGSTGMLRMVLGARFFSIVAHAGPGSVEAALESEIGDAVRALEKLRLLARMWRKTRHIPM
jgi:hypothetical protein